MQTRSVSVLLSAFGQVSVVDDSISVARGGGASSSFEYVVPASP